MGSWQKLGKHQHDVYGRFINADDVGYLTPEELTGANLYAYCNNNPVMYVDPTGHFLLSAFFNNRWHFDCNWGG